MTRTVPETDLRSASALRRLLSSRRQAGSRPRLIAELLVVTWLCWIYDAANDLAPMRALTAHANAARVLGVEHLLHVNVEASLDHWMTGHPLMAVLVSNYYDNAHFLVTLTLVAVLWWRFPDRYRPLRTGLALTNVIAILVFWILPTAPPRLYDPSTYIDIVAHSHAFGSWHDGNLATAANQLAAMPSLHIAWACWSALAVSRIVGPRKWKALAWLYPVLTTLAVLATGNHFVLDVAAGAVTFGLAMYVAERWQGWWTTRMAERAIAKDGAGLSSQP